ncbi:AEC family transporter [Shimia sp. MMG029]|uniref:AEC family transporter n=1 Tax=Shimia sp. MMG029 TaxID=3021978 RepID=UPI0022FF346E|nr:AEC family transporter [Shimia sp. MMG029]MDA5557715.1 AEC family transporter [Shimia sp. MMG029]
MQTLISVIMPVFILIGFGYLAAWRGYFSASNVDGLMRFATNFAVPVLLFRAISTLDLAAEYNSALLGSFYGAAFICFLTGMLGAKYLFGRDWEDATAIGFVCLFSNSLLLGLAIMERAYGENSLTGNYAIISIHAPFCYGLGIATMEIIRARHSSKARIVPTVLKAMFSNALILGIALGFVVNLGKIPMPDPLTHAVNLLASAALPAALFGMGGVLFRYRPEGDMRTILFCCAVSLGLHPALTVAFGTWSSLSVDNIRSAVVTASMAPGINAYLFANMYGRAMRVAASTVLIGTAFSVITIWLWLGTLP